MNSVSRPTISVLIITYNQEKLIGRALDSLIRQKDYLYEICVNDDRSTDGTFDVLLNYQRMYPELVKPVKNETNLFIFANTEASWKRAEGDLIYQLAGDDAVNDGFFKAVSDFVVENNLDCSREKLCIYTDYQQIEPSGLRMSFSNGMVLRHNPVKLKLRGLISPRGLFVSKSVLDSFVNVSDGRSYAVESAQDIQPQLFAEKNYHIPVAGEVYYSGIGVSVTMTSADMVRRAEEINKFLIAFLKGKGVEIDRSDRYYLKFMDTYRKWQFTHRAALLPRLLWYYLCSLDFSLGRKTLLFDDLLLVLKKKIFKRRDRRK